MPGKELFRFCTGKLNSLKKLFDVLKEVSSETPFRLSESGISVYLSKDYNIVKCNIPKESFDIYEYNYENPNETIVFSAREIHPIIKSINNSNSVEFVIYEDNKNMLYIRNKNSQKKELEEVEIKLLNLEDDYQDNVDCDKKLKLTGYIYSFECAKLVDITKKFNSCKSEFIFIETYVENSVDKISFFCKPNKLDVNKRKIVLDVSDSVQKQRSKCGPFKFHIKPIYYFMKGMNMSENSHNQVELNLSTEKNVNICVISYRIGDFGKISLLCTEPS